MMVSEASLPTLSFQIQRELAPILSQVKAHLDKQERAILGIDGRCASGKSTVASDLAAALDAPVIHMDQFFLRPHMRTAERLSEPGGNIDRERFWEEVALPLKAGLPFSYRPFLCHTMDFAEPIHILASPVIIVEGTYALSPALWDLYNVRLFLTVNPEKQMDRIVRRNGSAMAEIFKNRWIPMEEYYFNTFRPCERCDQVIDTTALF